MTTPGFTHCRIAGLRRGDPLICRDQWTHEICRVLYAVEDQLDDGKIHAAIEPGGMAIHVVYPVTGKVRNQSLYATRATAAEAEAAMRGIQQRTAEKAAKS
jgi:hypothetical protein